MTSIEARIWSTKMADNQHFRYINKLPCFKEIYGNWKRCLKAYSYTRKEHWTWSTNMAAMASKCNFECVIQYYTDQCFLYAKKLQQEAHSISRMFTLTDLIILPFFVTINATPQSSLEHDAIPKIVGERGWLSLFGALANDVTNSINSWIATQ